MGVISIDTREGHLGVDISNSDVCYGIKVDKVNSRDLLAKHGLEAGHVITKINDVEVSEHSHAMEIMNEAKAKGEKLYLTYLTVGEAKEQGAKEWKDIKKAWVIGIAVVIALVLFIVAGIKAGLLDKYVPSAEEPKKDTGPIINPITGEPDKNSNMIREMEGLMPGLAEMREQIQAHLPPDLKEKLKNFDPSNLPGYKPPAAKTWSAPDADATDEPPSYTIDK